MRILYIDIDTLRPDHLGCYGYHRDTSPNIDRLATDGVRFDNCYVSDAPCLPSRASTFIGQFGIHTGVVNHGGLAADLRPVGRERGFRDIIQRPGLTTCLDEQGIYCATVSPFAQRHGAWWFYAGMRDMVNPGKDGVELADDVLPHALRWIDRCGETDNWFFHVHLWDPHTPYRAPEDFGNPFADEPTAGWYTEEMRRQQWNSYGPGSPQEPGGSWGQDMSSQYPRWVNSIESMDDYKRWVDGYDCGIRYADQAIGKLLDALAEKGVLDDTMVIVTSDHGENMGELGVIGDHATADHVTSRVPLIVRAPQIPGGRADDALHYQTDFAASLVELTGGQVPDCWDGVSFASALQDGRSDGRDTLVVSQNCWSCQRAVRWEDWIFIRTYHTGLKNLPERMLFNVANDPHELDNLADRKPELADRGEALLARWTDEMMATSQYETDPLWTVMREGGPFHTRDKVEMYCDRLRTTGRREHADFLAANPTGLASE